MKKRLVTVFVFSVLIPGFVSALSPVLLAGVGAGGSWVATSDGEIQYYPHVSGSASGSYRAILQTGGYLATALLADLRYYHGDVDDLEDRYLLDLDFGTPLGNHRANVGFQLDSSLYNLGRGLLLVPSWKADLHIGQGSLTPRVGYFGSYRWQEGAVDDRSVQGVRAGFEREQSIHFGWGIDLLGAWEYYPDWKLFTADGGNSSDVRQDARIAVTGTVEGLLGFFTSWRATAGSGILLSNANRWTGASDGGGGELEERSEERVLSTLSGTLQASPHRNVGVRAEVQVENDLYLHRQYEEEQVNRFGLSGSVQLDFTPGGALYFVLDLGGGMEISNEPLLDGWYTSLAGRIEYSF